MEVVLIEMSFVTGGTKQKNKNENMERHSIFRPFKIQFYSRQGGPIFLLFGLWSLVLYLHVRVKSKSFPV